MSELSSVCQSYHLHDIELAKTKLASREIVSYIKNEFVNKVTVFPISQDYYLLVSDRDLEEAQKILQENDEISQEDF